MTWIDDWKDQLARGGHTQDRYGDGRGGKVCALGVLERFVADGPVHVRRLRWSGVYETIRVANDPDGKTFAEIGGIIEANRAAIATRDRDL